MADKQIHEFPTLQAAQDTDLILVSNENATYNISFATLKAGTKGDDGVGIASYVEYYAVNNSTTPPADSAFSTTYTEPTASNRYSWGFTRITYSDTPATVLDTNKHLLCVYGQTGNTGVYVTDITSYYLASASTSGVTRSTSGWSTTPLTLTSAKPYMWSYTAFARNSSGTLYSTPCIVGSIGTKGDKGDKGDTPSFSIGTVSTLPVGQSATASITGTDTAPVLNLGLPTGATGAIGPQGGQGIQGETGKSAYEIAVEQGYTGTEAQFGTEIANAGTYAATANTKAQQAAQSASDAASSAASIQSALTNYYTKTQTNNLLANKANASTTYTKTEVNNLLDAKADSADIPVDVSELNNDSGFITATDIKVISAEWNVGTIPSTNGWVSTNITIDAGDGWTAVGVVGWNTTAGELHIYRAYISGTTLVLGGHSVVAKQLSSVVVTIYLLCVRTA